MGGGQGGDRGEAAVEEERVVRRWHEDTLGVLRYQPGGMESWLDLID